MSASDSVLVGCLGSVAWVRVVGSATHENSGAIRNFLTNRFEAGWRRFVIDLGECPAIDSTFIGMLYRLASRVVESGDEKGGVEVLRASNRNAKSICKLGLDCLIKLDKDGDRWKDEWNLVEENISKNIDTPCLTRQEKTELVLDAHEALLHANQENESRFCDVVEFLRQDLASQTES